MAETPLRIGFIINPIAGMGGKVGLHGTDGTLFQEAVERGAVPSAHERAFHTLQALSDLSDRIILKAPVGEMGFDVAVMLGFETELIPVEKTVSRGSEKTKQSVRIMLESGVDLIVFAGGDGTARDVHEIVGEKVPLLGIPAGVKMRSGVFALTPEAASELVRSRLLDPASAPIRQVEILDVVLHGSDDLWPPSQFYGVARAPTSRTYLQMAKSTSSARGDAGIDELAEELAHSLAPDSLCLIGPGTTTHKIAAALGLEGAVGGVDAILNGKLIGKDLSEEQILTLLRAHTTVTLFLGIIGGQGFLLGRGNQQLSAKVIEQLLPENIVLVSSAEKVDKLFPPHLYVDLDDSYIESILAGYKQVLVAPGRSIVCRLVIPNRIQEEAIAV